MEYHETGDDMGEGGGGAPPSPGGEEQGREDTLFIHPSMLPSGMKVNAGDILEFKVVGTDAEGDIEVAYATGDDGGGDGKDWKSDLKATMAAPAGGGQEGGY